MNWIKRSLVILTVFSLSGCGEVNNLDWYENSDSIIAVVTKDSDTYAIGTDCNYLLDGEYKTVFQKKSFTMKPGMCYQIRTGKVFNFNMLQFIEKHGERFPLLYLEAIKKNAAAQDVKYRGRKKVSSSNSSI